MVRKSVSEKEIKKRKRLAMAVLVTCVAAAMIGGSLHVIELGAMRMDEMRGKVSYDIADVDDHIRAAGEDIGIQAAHEARLNDVKHYSVESLSGLLTADVKAELDQMIFVPKGPFEMGTNAVRSNRTDQPAHSVEVPDFWIDKYPVTMAQYAHFVVAKHYRSPLNWGKGKIPAAGVAGLVMVSVRRGRPDMRKQVFYAVIVKKAARGSDANRWPWGNKMDVSRLNTYYAVGRTTSVRHYTHGASPYGVMDMAGNVSEWVFDVFGPYEVEKGGHLSFKPNLDQFTGAGSEGVERTIKRVMRGGSWKSDPFSTESYHRNYSLPNMASDFFGFRCASSSKLVEVKR